jgi:hypothetical protein
MAGDAENHAGAEEGQPAEDVAAELAEHARAHRHHERRRLRRLDVTV